MSLEAGFAASPGTECTLGIRPEHLIVHHQSSPDAHLNSFEALVRSVEFIGHETLVYFESAGMLKCCRTSAASGIKTGDKVRMAFAGEHVLKFDTAGKRI